MPRGEVSESVEWSPPRSGKVPECAPGCGIAHSAVENGTASDVSAGIRCHPVSLTESGENVRWCGSRIGYREWTRRLVVRGTWKAVVPEYRLADRSRGTRARSWVAVRDESRTRTGSRSGDRDPAGHLVVRGALETVTQKYRLQRGGRGTMARLGVAVRDESRTRTGSRSGDRDPAGHLVVRGTLKTVTLKYRLERGGRGTTARLGVAVREESRTRTGSRSGDRDPAGHLVVRGTLKTVTQKYRLEL